MNHINQNCGRSGATQGIWAGAARVWISVVLISMLAMSSVSAQAQDDTDAEDEESPKALQAVTVTAQKREENIQDVPISVAVLSGEALDVLGSGGFDIRQLSSRLPSLQIESSFGRAFPRFYVRGLGNTDFDLNASQPVSFVVDGVVQENPILKGFPIFDIERVEMLRGPQGTLFGRNTPAGAVILESRKPSQVADGYAQINYGRFNIVNFEGAVGGALSDNWSSRLSVLFQRRDDFVDNTFTGEDDALEGYDEVAGRLQFLYDNGDGFSALTNFHFRSLDGTARLFRANIIQPGSNDLVEDFRRREVSIDGTNFQDLDAFGGSLTLSWEAGDYTVTSITGVEHADILSRGDVDGGFGASFAPPFGPGFIPFPAESADGLPEHIQITEEFRIASNFSGPVNWQGGLYFFFEDLTIDSFNFNTLAGGVQDGFAQQEQEATTVAAFLSGTFDLSDRLTLQVGGRISHDEKDFRAQRTQSPIGAGATGVLTAKPRDTEFSGDVSLNFAATDAVNYYARIARGFRAPSVQGRLLFGDTISVADTEVLHSFELGVKSLMLDNRVRANFSLFNYIIDDQQLTAVGGQANFNQLINADKTVGRGFELDVEAFVSQNLTFTAGLSFNDTEIKDDQLFIQPCGGGCTVLDPAGDVPGTVSIDGNRLPQAPRWVANSTLRYGIPVGEGEVFFFTDWAYRSAVNFFLFDSAEFRGESLLEGGVRLGYQWDLGNQEAALFVRNITDNTTIVGGIDFNNLTGFVNEPRIWGVEYRIGF